MADVLAADEVIIPVTMEYLADDGVYKVSCPSLQGCHAWGETLDEAMRAISGNVKAMLASRHANGSPIPPTFEHLGDESSFVLRLTAPA